MFQFLGPRDIFSTTSGVATSDMPSASELLAACDDFQRQHPPGQVVERIRCSAYIEQKLRENRPEEKRGPAPVVNLGAVPIEVVPTMPDMLYELVYQDGSSELVLPWGQKIRRRPPATRHDVG